MSQPGQLTHDEAILEHEREVMRWVEDCAPQLSAALDEVLNEPCVSDTRNRWRMPILRRISDGLASYDDLLSLVLGRNGSRHDLIETLNDLSDAGMIDLNRTPSGQRYTLTIKGRRSLAIAA
jgi:DNA-binding HxlR family transcriptional regulator